MKTELVLRDFSLNPSCEHGPTILFRRNGKGYFACSAFRSRKLCNFYQDEDSCKKKSKWSTKNESKKNILGPNPRNNKGQAQYFFDEDTISLFLEIIEDFDSVLCIGTPTIHRKIIKTKNSFLLDIQNFDLDHSAEYNMCNNYFFTNESQFTDFITNCKSLLVIMDPPFGVKPGLLKFCQDNLLKAVSDYNVIWLYPYFNEGHVMKCYPKLKMQDYRITYLGHPKLKKNPIVRMYVDFPVKIQRDGYKLCKKCDRYVHISNYHCPKCNDCTTKIGDRYRHCGACGKCVKDKYSHCVRCKMCHIGTCIVKNK